MLHNKIMLAISALVLLTAIVLAIIFGLRGTNRAAQTPTVNVSEVQTEAVATFASGLTRTVKAMPTSTLTSTPLPSETPLVTASVSATPSCYRLRFVRDVTIPDNTPMTPAEVFTKTWQVENNGICAWRPGFQLLLVGGLAMGGSPFTLAQQVNPGQRIEVSVKMVAPTNQTGIMQGTWRMADDNEAFFGDALTVVIVVGNETGTPTSAATDTPAP